MATITRRQALLSPLLAALGKVVGARTAPAQERPAASPAEPAPATEAVLRVTPQIEIDRFDTSFLPPSDLDFALVADTHTAGREAPPEPACFELELTGVTGRNDVNNPRTAKVYAQLAAGRPEFVIHLGDLVHGHPRDGRWPRLVKKANDLLRLLEVPTYLVPGNHDVGNKLSLPLRKRHRSGAKYDLRDVYYVSPENIKAFEEAFGPTYFHFESSGNLFLVVNASAFNSKLAEERSQWRWLEQRLAASGSFANVFLAMHSLPYWCRPDEPGEGNYEVVDEPARSRLLALCAEHDVRAIFAGHIHHDYVRYHGSTLIAASPSVSFSRDHWGLYHPLAPPTWDPARAAYCAVRVRGRKVVRQLVRTVELLPPVAPCQERNPFGPRRLMARQTGDGVAGVVAVTAPIMRQAPGLSAPGNAISPWRTGAERDVEPRIAWVSGDTGEQWLAVALALPRRISRVVLHPGIRRPFAYTLELRAADRPWAAVARGRTAPARGDSSPPALEHRIDGVEAVAVRLRVTDGAGRVSVRGLEVFDRDGVDLASLSAFARATASSSERQVPAVNTAAFSQAFDLNPSYLRLDPRATAFQAVSPVAGWFHADPWLIETARYARRQGARLWVVLSAGGANGRAPAGEGDFVTYCRTLLRALPDAGVWEIDGDRRQIEMAASAIGQASPRAELAVAESRAGERARFAVARGLGATAAPRRPTLRLHPPFPSRRQGEPAISLARWLVSRLGSEHEIPCVSLVPGAGLLDGWDDPMPAFYVVRAFNTVLAGARLSEPHSRPEPDLEAVHFASPDGRFIVARKASDAGPAPASIRLRASAAKAWWIDPLTSTSRQLVVEGRQLRGLLFPEYPVILRLV